MPWGTADLPLSPAVKAEKVAEAVKALLRIGDRWGLEQPIEIFVGMASRRHKSSNSSRKCLPTCPCWQHGRSGFERLFLGLGDERVLRTATVPV